MSSGMENLQQSQQLEPEDGCKNEISIKIAKMTLRCTLNKSHAAKFLHLKIFEKV